MVRLLWDLGDLTRVGNYVILQTSVFWIVTCSRKDKVLNSQSSLVRQTQKVQTDKQTISFLLSRLAVQELENGQSRLEDELHKLKDAHALQTSTVESLNSRLKDQEREAENSIQQRDSEVLPTPLFLERLLC